MQPVPTGLPAGFTGLPVGLTGLKFKFSRATGSDRFTGRFDRFEFESKFKSSRAIGLPAGLTGLPPGLTGLTGGP